MPEPAKIESAVVKIEEDRLANVLMARGLVTREEVQQCRARAGAPAGAELLLSRLVESSFLSASQAARLQPELPSIVGQAQPLPGFQILEKIGQGAMGTVYKAKQLSMNRLVAVKVLPTRLASNPEYVERFTREAHAAAKLSHNNIVQAIDVKSVGGLHYFIMEYVEGKSIRDELDTGRVYEEKEAIELVLQIAQALHHAHKRGLVHRDIKPANIIVTPENVAKLADLGLARETEDKTQSRREKGRSIGTPYYMSPEQVRGRTNIDGRADIYSLGATVYHMVTGQPPYPGKKADEVMQAHLDQELTPPDHIVPDLSAGFGEVVEVMLAKERKQRYQTPDALILDLMCLLNDEPPKLARRGGKHRAALEDLAEHEAEQEPDEEERPRPSRRGRRSKNVIWLAVLGGLLVLSALLNLVLLLLRHF